MSLSRSFPENTATTPSASFARAVSIPRIRACAWVLRTTCMKSIPGSVRSSMKLPVPVTSSGSSRRLTGAPISWEIAISFPSSTNRSGSFDGLPGGHHLRGRLDGLDDVVVTGAAAQIALQPQPDLALGWVWIALQELLGRHDHARGAEAALQPVLIPERLLQRVKLRSLGQTFDRRDLGAVGLDGEQCARLDAVPVQLNRTGTAVARIAADVRSGQSCLLADVVDQQRSWFDLVFILRPI